MGILSGMLFLVLAAFLALALWNKQYERAALALGAGAMLLLALLSVPTHTRPYGPDVERSAPQGLSR